MIVDREPLLLGTLFVFASTDCGSGNVPVSVKASLTVSTDIHRQLQPATGHS